MLKTSGGPAEPCPNPRTLNPKPLRVRAMGRKFELKWLRHRACSRDQSGSYWC